MKKYNIENYIRYKEDLSSVMPKDKDWESYTRNELITKFMPLVENLARKFSTAQQASGVMDITDLIQCGNEALTRATDKLDFNLLKESDDVEKTLKSFFSKRVKGAIRRQIDINRGDMRIPEHKLNEIRKDNGKDKRMVEMFFNSIFLSIDAQPKDQDGDNLLYQIPDKSEPYNIHLLNAYLTSLLKKNLTGSEYEVLRLSYGLDCEKHSAKQIAEKLNITGTSDYVRIS